MFEATRIFPRLKNFESLRNKSSNAHKNLYLHNRTYCLIIIQKCTILKREKKKKKYFKRCKKRSFWQIVDRCHSESAAILIKLDFLRTHVDKISVFVDCMRNLLTISTYLSVWFLWSLPPAIRGILIFRLWRHLWITQASPLSLLWKISSNIWQRRVNTVFPNKHRKQSRYRSASCSPADTLLTTILSSRNPCSDWKWAISLCLPFIAILTNLYLFVVC